MNENELFKKVMVFAAHPDDEVIGCGGSIAKHLKNGRIVEVSYMSSTDASQTPDKTRIREKEAKNACKVLGVNNFFFLREPGRYIQYNRKTVETVVTLLKKESPSCVYVHDSRDWDIDHRATYKIVSEACWLSGLDMPQCGTNKTDIKFILLYEIWTPLQDFQYSEDISQFMDTKISALQKYKSQLSTVRYDEAIRGLNIFRGIMSGSGEYAEVFKIKRLRP